MSDEIAIVLRGENNTASAFGAAMDSVQALETAIGRADFDVKPKMDLAGLAEARVQLDAYIDSLTDVEIAPGVYFDPEQIADFRSEIEAQFSDIEAQLNLDNRPAAERIAEIAAQLDALQAKAAEGTLTIGEAGQVRSLTAEMHGLQSATSGAGAEVGGLRGGLNQLTSMIPGIGPLIASAFSVAAVVAFAKAISDTVLGLNAMREESAQIEARFIAFGGGAEKATAAFNLMDAAIGNAATRDEKMAAVARITSLELTKSAAETAELARQALVLGAAGASAEQKIESLTQILVTGRTMGLAQYGISVQSVTERVKELQAANSELSDIEAKQIAIREALAEKTDAVVAAGGRAAVATVELANAFEDLKDTIADKVNLDGIVDSLRNVVVGITADIQIDSTVASTQLAGLQSQMGLLLKAKAALEGGKPLSLIDRLALGALDDADAKIAALQLRIDTMDSSNATAQIAAITKQINDLQAAKDALKPTTELDISMPGVVDARAQVFVLNQQIAELQALLAGVSASNAFSDVGAGAAWAAAQVAALKNVTSTTSGELAAVSEAVGKLEGGAKAADIATVAMAIFTGQLTLAAIEANGLIWALDQIATGAGAAAQRWAGLGEQYTAGGYIPPSSEAEGARTGRTADVNRWVGLGDRYQDSSEDAAKKLAAANKTAAEKTRAAWEAAFDAVANSAKSEFSKAQDQLKGLLPDMKFPGLGNNEPGSNGPFENIFRAADVAKLGAASPWAAQLGLTQDEAKRIVSDFAQGFRTPEVRKLIDEAMLVDQAKQAEAAAASLESWGNEIAAKAGVSASLKAGGKAVSDAIFGGLASGKDASGKDTTGPQSTSAAEALKAFESAFSTEVKKEDFQTRMGLNGEAMWAAAEPGIVRRAKASTAWNAAIQAMVDSAIAASLED